MPSAGRGGIAGGACRTSRRSGDGEFGIHQILAAASPGDAITNVALEYRDVLRRIGPSDVFARHIAPSSADEVRPLSEFGRDGSGGLLVYHASIGEPAVSSFLLSRPEPIVLVYHNITPAKYFDGIDDTFAELLVFGRLELESIRHRVTLAIADSHFNAAELHAIGYEDVRVIPPVVDPFRLVRIEPDKPTLTHIDTTFTTPMLLFVGQVLPHKRPDLLVKAMHVAATYFGVEAHLLLVGQNRFARYADAVSAQIRELNLAQRARGGTGRRRAAGCDVPAGDRVRDGERARRLLRAGARGDGVRRPDRCRARARRSPRPSATGGLLLPSWAGAELVAEAIARVVDDADLRQELRRPRPRPSRGVHRGGCERLDARGNLRGRVMRVLYVVQRYGEQIAGGAEQHARAFAERLVERDHHVTVLTTCAQSYTDWANEYPRGWSKSNGVSVFRVPVEVSRNPHLFSRFNARMSQAEGVRPLALQREWMQMQGPYAPELVPWIRHNARTYDAVVFITYLYWSTWAGLRECAGAVPTLLHPTAHDEPPLRLSIFQEVLRAPDAFAFLTPEEADLVRERFPEAPPGEVVGIGVETNQPGDADSFRRRYGSGGAPYLLYVGRVDPAKGASELIEYFVGLQEPQSERPPARAARRAARRRPGARRHRHDGFRRRGNAQRRARRARWRWCTRRTSRASRWCSRRCSRSAGPRWCSSAARSSTATPVAAAEPCPTPASPSSRRRSTSCALRPSWPTRWVPPAAATSSASTTGTSSCPGTNACSTRARRASASVATTDQTLAGGNSSVARVARVTRSASRPIAITWNAAKRINSVSAATCMLRLTRSTMQLHDADRDQRRGRSA